MDKGTAPGRPGRCPAMTADASDGALRGGAGAPQGGSMVGADVRCVVGVEVAKHSHMVCALAAPSGAVRQRAFKLAATVEGYAQLRAALARWGEPHEVLVVVEATGCLWEPLYDALAQAGYRLLVLNPRQTASWAAS